jgi:hypothetical protein
MYTINLLAVYVLGEITMAFFLDVWRNKMLIKSSKNFMTDQLIDFVGETTIHRILRERYY